MKNVFSLFFVCVVFLTFSCTGTPKSGDSQADNELLVEDNFNDETDEPEESAQTGVTDPLAEEDFLADGLPAPDESAAEPLEESVSGESFAGGGLSEPVMEKTDAEPVSFEESASIAEAPLTMGTPLPAPQPPAEPEPPVPPPAPPPEQIPPPVTMPPETRPPTDRPPSVPPSLLGPAEEKPPASDRENNIPFKRDDSPPVPSVLKDEPPASSMMLVTPQDAEVVFSRTVRAVAGQIVEIPFRGTGWIYLGELASRRGIVYNSSRLDTEGQSLIFRVEEAGTYLLKFYKRDYIRDYILEDHVQVIAGEAPAAGAGWFNPPVDRGRVAAQPRWPSALEEAELRRGGSSSPRPAAEVPAAREPVPSQGTSVQPQSGEAGVRRDDQSAARPAADPSPGTFAAGEPAASPGGAEERSPSAPDTPAVTGGPSTAGTVPERQEWLPPDGILQKAKETFDGGNVASAIALLDQFREVYPLGSDEAYWLYGQFYEANSPSRDILLALDYYRRLVREYPQSGRCNDANRRIAYLERFYINIQ